jgi:hypothetical protein
MKTKEIYSLLITVAPSVDVGGVVWNILESRQQENLNMTIIDQTNFTSLLDRRYRCVMRQNTNAMNGITHMKMGTAIVASTRTLSTEKSMFRNPSTVRGSAESRSSWSLANRFNILPIGVFSFEFIVHRYIR